MKTVVVQKAFFILVLILLLMGGYAFTEEVNDTKIQIEILQREGTSEDLNLLHEKYLALLFLTEKGTEEAIPAIVPYLKSDELSYHARVALRNIPGDQGRLALRKSLDFLQGKYLAGVIQTLGAMRDTASMEKFILLLASDDSIVVESVIDVLGKLAIVSEKDKCDIISKVLFGQMEKKDSKYRTEAAFALIAYADSLLMKRDEQGKLILERIEKADVSEVVTTIAKRRSEGRVKVPKLKEENKVAVPNPDEFALLLDKIFTAKEEKEVTNLKKTAKAICREARPGSGLENVLAGKMKSATAEQKIYCIELLVHVGTRLALRNIALLLNSEKEDKVIDQVTQALGEWISMDVAPYLLPLAKSYPIEKYRTRAFRGYLRLIRQMVDTAPKKVEMIKEITPAAKTDNEKKMLAELSQQVENQRRDTLLFDGKSFNRWEGNLDLFRIEDGTIIAGTMEQNIPRNEFLCTKEVFRDFTLTLECKIMGKGANAGVQFRSVRIPNHHEMKGYQADMSEDGTYWGQLYDESRRNRFLQEANKELQKKIYKPNDWNEYKITCWGKNIRIWLNGCLTVDYTEKEDVSLEGVIGLQIHQGGPSQAFYRNIRIERYQTLTNR